MDANEGSPTIEDVLPSNEEGGNGPPAGGALEEETLRLMQMSGNAVFEQARTTRGRPTLLCHALLTPASAALGQGVPRGERSR